MHRIGVSRCAALRCVAAAAMQASLEQTIGDLMQTKQCLRCRAFYTTMDDVGQWRCRVHPGFLQAVTASVWGTEPGTYSCCGASPHPRHPQWAGDEAAAGCTPCDHTTTRGRPNSLLIGLERAQVFFGNRLLGEGRPGISVNERDATVSIVRYSLFAGQ